MSKTDDYEEELARLQLALVETQVWARTSGVKLCVLFEGRDSAGKDGSIARIVEHLSIRSTRVVALPKPTERERTEWYFQRYALHLPAAGELVIFNRSWYNRGGVEPVMGFCTPPEHEQFLRDAPDFERMLVESGVKLVKLWLDIGKEEQAKRLEARRADPLKQLKLSDLDAAAQAKWDAYSAARDEMLTRTQTPLAPWWCVRADHKKAARLNIMRHLVLQAGCPTLSVKVARPEPQVLFPFELEALKDGRLAR